MTTEPLDGPRRSSTSPADWITQQARHQPQRRCLVEADGTIHDFGTINARVNRLVRALRQRGIERHARIGILATDSVDYMVLLMASLKLGSTYVPLNYRLAPAELEVFARTAQLDALVTMGRYADLIEGLAAVCPRLRLVAAFDEVPGYDSVSALIDSVDNDSGVISPTEPEDIISLMFTSGTTGNPKGVMQSLRMLSTSTAGALIEFGFSRDELRYTASPMFHAAGMGCVYYGVARGFASLITPQYDPDVVVHWLQNGLTGMLVMPTMLSAILQLDDVRRHEYPHLRSICYGGAPITPALLRQALDVFECDFFNTFGAGTEAAGQCVFTPADHLRALAGEEHLLGSIGRPVYGVELRLCDDDLNDVPRGEIGEICTRSDWVMSGYLDDPDRTEQAVVDGWFRAGDLAWMDQDGYLFLAGRRNDMIIRGGENVYPVEIESVVADHPSVLAVAVIGLPDDYWGETVAAVIEVAYGATVDIEAIRTDCRTRLAAYKVPATIITVGPGEMPRNVNGKVQKHVLRQRAASLVPARP